MGASLLGAYRVQIRRRGGRMCKATNTVSGEDYVIEESCACISCGIGRGIVLEPEPIEREPGVVAPLKPFERFTGSVGRKDASGPVASRKPSPKMAHECIVNPQGQFAIEG